MVRELNVCLSEAHSGSLLPPASPSELPTVALRYIHNEHMDTFSPSPDRQVPLFNGTASSSFDNVVSVFIPYFSGLSTSARLTYAPLDNTSIDAFFMHIRLFMITSVSN